MTKTVICLIAGAALLMMPGHVTAKVTDGGTILAPQTKTTILPMRAEAVVQHEVHIRDVTSGRSFKWLKNFWASDAECKLALGNANAVFLALADDMVPPEQVPNFDGTDKEMIRDLGRLIIALSQHGLPRLTATCLPRGDPA